MLLPIDELQKVTRFEYEDCLNNGTHLEPFTRILVYSKTKGIFGKTTETCRKFKYDMTFSRRDEETNSRMFKQHHDAEQLIEQLDYYCKQKWEESKTAIKPELTEKQKMFGEDA